MHFRPGQQLSIGVIEFVLLKCIRFAVYAVGVGVAVSRCSVCILRVISRCRVLFSASLQVLLKIDWIG